MEAALRTRLLQLSPWLRRPGCFGEEVARLLPPTFVPRAVAFGPPEPGRARLVVGPRQAGKSTLVWSWLRELDPSHLLYLDAEETLVRTWARSPIQMVADLAEELPTVRVLFIDEAQHLDEAGLTVKGLVDARRGLEVLVTGSSSFHLQAGTRESLAGRADRRRLLPFSLGELLRHDASPLPAVQRERAREILRRQLVWGSYPPVWFHPDPERLLADLVEAFVLRDASDRFRLRHPVAFRRLLQLAASQVGQQVNLSEWAGLLGISATTVSEYLGLAEESWLLRLVPPFAGGGRREISSAPRVHLYDMGLRNALLGALSDDLDRRPDRGALAEGWAFGELAKCLPHGWTLHYWRTKGGAEVDFVLARGPRRLGVEVKAGSRVRLTRSARSFVEAYQPEAFLVAGLDVEPEEKVMGRTRLFRLPLTDMAATVDGLLLHGGASAPE